MAETVLPSPGGFGTDLTRLEGNLKKAGSRPAGLPGRSGSGPWNGMLAGMVRPLVLTTGGGAAVAAAAGLAAGAAVAAAAGADVGGAAAAVGGGGAAVAGGAA